MSWQERTELLLGEKKERLNNAHVLIIGTGGVGAWAIEMLVRAGIGAITIIDSDVVNSSNINRQLPALHSTIGEDKVEVLKQRMLDINPVLKIKATKAFLTEDEMLGLLQADKYDYVIDAIDTLAPKTHLIYNAVQLNLPIISSMGAGAKWDPEAIMVSQLSKTHTCKLARTVRKRLGKFKLAIDIPVVFSTEELLPEAVISGSKERNKASTIGTVSYMPAIFGCKLAAYVIRDLCKD